MGEFLSYDQGGAVVTLTMDQPETRNALTGNTAIEEIVAACERIARDPSVRAVVLTGAGAAFSSGGNLKDMSLPEALALAGRIAANPGPALRMTKRLLREGQHLRLDSLLELSATFQAIAQKSSQHAEAVNAFLEKRAPRFED